MLSWIRWFFLNPEFSFLLDTFRGICFAISRCRKFHRNFKVILGNLSFWKFDLYPQISLIPNDYLVRSRNHCFKGYLVIATKKKKKRLSLIAIIKYAINLYCETRGSRWIFNLIITVTCPIIHEIVNLSFCHYLAVPFFRGIHLLPTSN